MGATHHLSAGSRNTRCDHPGHGGRYTIDLADDGIIDMHVWGFWEEADVPRFFDLLGAIHVTARGERGRVRQLVRLDAVQSPTVAFHVQAGMAAIRQRGDRMAVVVATALSRLQIKRLGEGRNFGVFTDSAEARVWLLAD